MIGNFLKNVPSANLGFSPRRKYKTDVDLPNWFSLKKVIRKRNLTKSVLSYVLGFHTQKICQRVLKLCKFNLSIFKTHAV